MERVFYDDSFPPVPRLFDLINRHSLILFLISNVLTGLINLLVPTMYTSAPVSMILLFLYMAIVCAVAPVWVYIAGDR